MQPRRRASTACPRTHRPTMKVSELNWMQVERYLEGDDRVVLPLGSVEQHGYLSLATDAILAERIAVEAAEPLGIPVYPALPYGLAPYFMAYPGTVTLRQATYDAVVADLLDSLHETGFRRVLLVSGHGGNAPAGRFARAWAEARPAAEVLFHEWWHAPRTRAAVESEGLHGSHANWMESYPWTRVAGGDPPRDSKPPVGLDDESRLEPERVRELLGDGSFGGAYRIDDAAMTRIWAVGVAETRDLLEHGWHGGGRGAGVSAETRRGGDAAAGSQKSRENVSPETPHPDVSAETPSPEVRAAAEPRRP